VTGDDSEDKMQTRIIILKHYRAILANTGMIMSMVGVLMFTPLLVLFAWHDEWIYAKDFAIPALVLIGVGGALWRILKSRIPASLTIQDGGVVVLLSWVIASVFAGFPFMSVLGLNFTQAVFEAVSGWTTTGLSVVDVAKAPNMVLLWRSITQLIGGAGLAIITLAAITGPTGAGLTIAEGRTEQLAPHVRSSIKRVVILYAGYAVDGIILYKLAGMNFFDAINHSFAAISTGGFSTKPENIAFWDSTAIDLVSVPLMILGNMNFLTVYLLVKGKFKAVYRNGEVKAMAVLIPVSAILVFFLVSNTLYSTLGKSIRVAIVEVVTALTTTGFMSTVYTEWNSFGYLVLIILMIIGGGTCSTAGGIKQYRVYLLFKSFIWEIRRAFLPKNAVVENYFWRGDQKEYISSELLRQLVSFVSLYICIYILGSGIIAAHGYKLNEAMFEFASALSTVGLSCGVSVASAPPLVLWTETIGMFLGRLEFFVIFISLGKIVQDSFAILGCKK
jgi:trk system potassium uptake protein TrkH